MYTVFGDEAMRDTLLDCTGHRLETDENPDVEARIADYVAEHPCTCLDDYEQKMKVDCQAEDAFPENAPTDWSRSSRRQVLLERMFDGTDHHDGAALLKENCMYWSETLKSRTLLKPKVVWQWLSKRPDLIDFVDTLVDSSYLGWQCFSSTVAAHCHLGKRHCLDMLSRAGIMKCCFRCAMDRFSKLKLICKEHRGKDPDGFHVFNHQYLEQLLGRLDLDHFRDVDDREERIDYDAQRSGQTWLDGICNQCETELHKQLKKLGQQFADATLNSWDRPAFELTPVIRMLVGVPTGSVTNDEIPEGMLREFEKLDVNKKLAFAFMSQKEAEKFWMDEELHTRSGVSDKLEIAKLRSLVRGSMGIYYHMQTTSAVGEKRFTADIPEVPMLQSGFRKTRTTNAFIAALKRGFGSARDFRNYNRSHLHSEIKMFYASAAKRCRELGRDDFAEHFEAINKCLDDVGVYLDDGAYYKWVFGLMSGWRHTMLLNNVFNVSEGRAVATVLEELVGITLLMALHQGDDSAESWDHPLGGPFAQSILDRMGRPGKSEKQTHRKKLASPLDFLRKYMDTETGDISMPIWRGLGGMLSSDSQHPPFTGGLERVATNVEGFNMLIRRTPDQTTQLRWSDIAALSQYWATPSDVFRETQEELPWELAFIPLERGGKGVRWLGDPCFWYDANVEVETIVRRQERERPVFESRVRGKVHLMSRLDLTPYWREIVGDILDSAATRYTEVLKKKTSANQWREDSPLTDKERRSLDFIVKEIRRGGGSYTDYDEDARQAAIGILFAGSPSAAVAWIRDNAVVPGLHTQEGTVLLRGLNVLKTGRTEEEPANAWTTCPGEDLAIVRACWKRWRLSTPDAVRQMAHLGLWLSRGGLQV
jgi:hypothetical protein